jgi:Mce-associated membrane protein
VARLRQDDGMTTAGGGGATGGGPPTPPHAEGTADGAAHVDGAAHADGAAHEPDVDDRAGHAHEPHARPPQPSGVAVAWPRPGAPEPHAGSPEPRPGGDPPRPWWPRAGGPDHASWGARVVAHLLDTAVLAAVTYLALEVQPVAAPTPAPVFLAADAPSRPPGSWLDSPWVVLAVVVLALLQAYVGSTPGKLVVGIAVVRDSDGRPAGLVRTVVRWFAHLLDALLWIGYLRPLWQAERRTFADSLLSTVVVRRVDARTPTWWDAGPARATAAAAWVVCVAAAVFQLGPYSVWSSGTVTSDCRVPGTGGSAGPGAGGSLVVSPADGPVGRWGVERRQVDADGWVEVRWERVGEVATPGAYRVTVARPDGTGARTYAVDVVEARADGSAALENGGGPMTDFSLEGATVVARFAASTFDDLGDTWEWTLTSDAGGVRTGPCTGTAERWGA